MPRRRRLELPPEVPVEQLPPTRFVPSSIVRLNEALGGGLPRRGIVEMYGAPSGGKSSLALSFQPDLYIDLERSLEPRWASKLAPGMPVARPDTLEEAFQLAERALSRSPQLIVLDSLGGGIAEKELESAQQGAMSQATSKWLRRLVPLLDDTCLLIVNQIRASFSAYGSPITTPGGHLLHHLALQRIEVKRLKVIEIGDRKVGQEVLVRVVKNKVGPPFSEVSVCLDFMGNWYASEEELKNRLRSGL